MSVTLYLTNSGSNDVDFFNIYTGSLATGSNLIASNVDRADLRAGFCVDVPSQVYTVESATTFCTSRVFVSVDAFDCALTVSASNLGSVTPQPVPQPVPAPVAPTPAPVAPSPVPQPVPAPVSPTPVPQPVPQPVPAPVAPSPVPAPVVSTTNWRMTLCSDGSESNQVLEDVGSLLDIGVVVKVSGVCYTILQEANPGVSPTQFTYTEFEDCDACLAS